MTFVENSPYQKIIQSKAEEVKDKPLFTFCTRDEQVKVHVIQSAQTDIITDPDSSLINPPELILGYWDLHKGDRFSDGPNLLHVNNVIVDTNKSPSVVIEAEPLLYLWHYVINVLDLEEDSLKEIQNSHEVRPLTTFVCALTYSDDENDDVPYLVVHHRTDGNIGGVAGFSELLDSSFIERALCEHAEEVQVDDPSGINGLRAMDCHVDKDRIALVGLTEADTVEILVVFPLLQTKEEIEREKRFFT